MRERFVKNGHLFVHDENGGPVEIESESGRLVIEPGTRVSRTPRGGWELPVTANGEHKHTCITDTELTQLVGRGWVRDPYTDEDGSSPELLDNFKHRIEALRRDMLCNIDGSCLGVMSEQNYLLALDALGSAQRFMQIAVYFRRRGD